jgi:hypothetical protein
VGRQFKIQNAKCKLKHWHFALRNAQCPLCLVP